MRVGAPDFDQVVEESHRAWGEFVRGDAEPAKKLFSQKDDVTIANPFGPVQRGRENVAATMERAATLYRDGEVIAFERMAEQTTPDLGYIVEVERYRARIGGRPDITPVTLRVTSVLRREDDGWKIVHRHADPITSARPAESVIQT
jgi:ketosteroid isomerase-like protein